jgi:hypothetical protein
MGSKVRRGLDAQGLTSYYGNPERPYRPTTKETRKALGSSVTAAIQESGDRIREMICRNEEWRDTE